MLIFCLREDTLKKNGVRQNLSTQYLNLALDNFTICWVHKRNGSIRYQDERNDLMLVDDSTWAWGTILFFPILGGSFSYMHICTIIVKTIFTCTSQPKTVRFQCWKCQKLFKLWLKCHKLFNTLEKLHCHLNFNIKQFAWARVVSNAG